MRPLKINVILSNELWDPRSEGPPLRNYQDLLDEILLPKQGRYCTRRLHPWESSLAAIIKARFSSIMNALQRDRLTWAHCCIRRSPHLLRTYILTVLSLCSLFERPSKTGLSWRTCLLEEHILFHLFCFCFLGEDMEEGGVEVISLSWWGKKKTWEQVTELEILSIFPRRKFRIGETFFMSIWGEGAKEIES